MGDEAFDATSTELSRLARCSPNTVRAYAKAGLIECITLTSGVHLFKRSSAQVVRRLRIERLGHRGGNYRAAALNK
jgi:DNA-binding transcriptional MerR regulator